MYEVKPCPFCGSSDIRYSVKAAPDKIDASYRHISRFYIAMYCQKCHCYGSRVVVTPDTSVGYNARYEVENSSKYKERAIAAWNKRT